MKNATCTAFLVVSIYCSGTAVGGEIQTLPGQGEHHHGSHVDHSAHMAMMNRPLERSVQNYSMPFVELVNQDGEVGTLESYLPDDKIAVVDFIFTTCTTICPVLTAGLGSFHESLKYDAKNISLVSITIDPEHDTPDVLKAYSVRYGMKPGHELLTGSRKNINAVMQAFDAEMPNKMTHYPLTFFRGAGKHEWIRVFGLMNTRQMLKEYNDLTKS